MKEPPASPRTVADALCLTCGICCNGVLFADVEIQPGEDASALAGLPLQVRPRPATRRPIPPASSDPAATDAPPALRFPQPCAALCVDKSCRIYSQRPRRCREFECALFLAVADRRLSVETALRRIRRTLTQAGKVTRLLRELGDTDEARPLAQRFNRVSRRLDRAQVDEETGDLFGELTLAVQELNLLLSRDFYP